jgi:DNA-directed RNA polymerase sigma subunit (sigma70/sigma32)
LETQDVLTNEDQYRGITKLLPRLTKQQEMEIVRRARAGDPVAREELIMSCLNYVGSIANWYKQFLYHDEYLDLVGVGNLSVVEAFDQAILKENPCGYLRGVAKYTIIHYCYTRATLIVRPDHTTEAIYIRSLDEKPYTYDTLVRNPPVAVTKHPDYSFLYQALEKLPKAYRDVLKKHFGLYDSQPESLYALSRRKKANVKGTAFYNTKDRALRRLRKLLMQQQGKIVSYAVNT